MAYEYNNIDYKNALDAYRAGNDSMILIELKYLSRADVPSYDKETFYFINEALLIAKKKNDNEKIAILSELSRRMDSQGAAGFAHTSILEGALQTEHDCMVALDKCLQNDQYEVILTSIIDFIKAKRNFHIALMVLERIDESIQNSDTTRKEDIALYFIERMQSIIDIDIQPKPILAGLWGYKSDRWGKKEFRNDDYVHYRDLVIKLLRQFKKGR